MFLLHNSKFYLEFKRNANYFSPDYNYPPVQGNSHNNKYDLWQLQWCSSSKTGDFKDDKGDWGISSSESRQNKDEIPHPGEREAGRKVRQCYALRRFRARGGTRREERAKAPTLAIRKGVKFPSNLPHQNVLASCGKIRYICSMRKGVSLFPGRVSSATLNQQPLPFHYESYFNCPTWIRSFTLHGGLRSGLRASENPFFFRSGCPCGECPG